MKISSCILSCVLVAVFLVFLVSPPASAGVVQVTDRGSLGANDAVDWSQLGDAVNFVSSGSAITSNLGLTGSITNTSTSVGLAFRRVDQGVGGWRGNFQDLAPLLFTNYSNGPLVIDFDTPVFGVGAQIQSHVGAGSPTSTSFTAFLRVYGADDATLLGTFSAQGMSNNYADDSAIFLGAVATEAEIGRIEYYITLSGSLDRSLAINYLRVKSPTHSLGVTKTGAGSVSSFFPGISCGAVCNAAFASNARVSLSAAASSGSYFAGWGPPCSGYSLCTIILAGDAEVKATFSPGYYDTVQKTYIGYYQRAGDPEGLIYWAGRLGQSGGILTDIIEAFAHSPEAQTLYGQISSSNISTVVNGIYKALFNRDAEYEGLNYYVNGFNAGIFTAATIMLNVLDGARNADLVTLNDKVATANLFSRTIDPEFDGMNLQVTYAGDEDAIKARAFLASVTDNPATVPTQNAMSTWMKNNVADPGDPILSR